MGSDEKVLEAKRHAVSQAVMIAGCFLDGVGRHCESPMEELLLYTVARDQSFLVALPVAMFAAECTIQEMPGKSGWWAGVVLWRGTEFSTRVIIQYEPADVAARFDFAFITVKGGVMTGAPIHRLDVEVDGHDFHERTKEQASRDRSRDREALIAGWDVVRFTGSDVYRDARRCVLDIMDLIGSKVGAKWNAHQ
jgi:hypothetical protein